ncbi:MAG TPA: hypothetical protein VMZ53_05855 [Kofleriaceae bacterium]|nr:hypothetical protein [Kofleriaceae bacterium]
MSVARANGVVLESYTGERPKDAARLLGPVLEELARKKYDAGDTVARAYESQISRSSMTAGGMPADFAAQVDVGFKAWVGGRFDEAIKVLVPLVETAHGNSGEFARNPALREPLLKGLIALALAYQRIGDLGAMQATFREIIRAYPDAQIARAKYGPDAATAFEGVAREVQAGGTGKLTVKLADDTGVVFIDEAYRAAGSTTVELVPGEYRVVAMLNKQPSRSHLVNVRANANVTVEIDVKLDQAVRTVGYAGLQFASESDREEHEAQYAAAFATAVGANAVAVVGIDDVKGRPAVVGSLVSLQTGREIRRASIPVDPDPSTDRLRALARFLGGEEPAPGLEVQFARAVEKGEGAGAGGGGGGGGGNHADTGAGGDGGGARWGGWRFVTGGLAVVGIGVGATLVALDGKCSKEPPAGMQCNDLYATKTPGFVSLGAGAVFAGLSIYLFATHGSSDHKSGVSFVAPTRGGAVAGYSLVW